MVHQKSYWFSVLWTYKLAFLKHPVNPIQLDNFKKVITKIENTNLFSDFKSFHFISKIAF